MNVDFWVCVSATKTGYGYRPSVPKASKNKPNVGRNEVAVKVTLEIPDSYFELPELKASIVLPDVRNKQPEAKVEMQQRIADTLKDSLGVNVTFEVNHD